MQIQTSPQWMPDLMKPLQRNLPPPSPQVHAEIHPRLRGMPGLCPNVYSAYSIPCIPPWLLTYGPSLQKLLSFQHLPLSKAQGRSAEQRTHRLWCWALAGHICRAVAQRGTLESDSGNFLLWVTPWMWFWGLRGLVLWPSIRCLRVTLLTIACLQMGNNGK